MIRLLLQVTIVRPQRIGLTKIENTEKNQCKLSGISSQRIDSCAQSQNTLLHLGLFITLQNVEFPVKTIILSRSVVYSIHSCDFVVFEFC